MKYKAVIDTDNYKGFKFYEDGNEKYMFGKDACASAYGGWIPIYFTEYEPEQKARKGEWLRMSYLTEQDDDRYKCSRCGNVVHYKDKMNLYTFSSWCGRCGSDNGRK